MTRQEINNEIAEQAEWWFVHIESGDSTSADIAQFEAWLNTDRQHQLAYCRTVEICQQISQLRHINALEPVNGKPAPPFARHNQSSRPRNIVFAGALAAIVSMIIAVIFLYPSAPEMGEYVTGIGEVKDIVLSDGTSVSLGARSKLTVKFMDTERHVTLHNGEAFFQVMTDPERNFIVISADTSVQVIGTQFNVHASPTAVTIAVLEGQVSVKKHHIDETAVRKSQRETRILSTGEQMASLRSGTFEDTVTVATDELASWRTGKLIYHDSKLRDVIADANRYSKHPIIIGSPTLENLTITAAFGTNQIDKMIDGLTDILPVKVIHATSKEILLMPAK